MSVTRRRGRRSHQRVGSAPETDLARSPVAICAGDAVRRLTRAARNAGTYKVNVSWEGPSPPPPPPPPRRPRTQRRATGIPHVFHPYFLWAALQLVVIASRV